MFNPRSSMRLSRTFRMNVLHSRGVLYFVFLVALINLYLHLMRGDMFSIMAFMLSGFLTTYFSKNMVVVLCTAIVTTNILKYGKDVISHEGFEGESGDATKAGDTPEASTPIAEPAADVGSAPKPPNPEETEEIKRKYKELLELQKQIVDGVKNVYEPLQKAETIVAGMKESMLSRGVIKELVKA